MTIHDLKPEKVWSIFHQITQVPRPSKHEEKIRTFLLEWAKREGIEAFCDKSGNVIMRKPATNGYENRPGIIFQGHMDMVPQKNVDKVHDFLNDPIETLVDGDWLRANGTTLGADNGLGLAIAMAILASNDIKHGPLELLATYDEETGMTGATNIEPGILKGSILINLDSEEEGELCIGCAGGLDVTAEDSYNLLPTPDNMVCYRLAVKGFSGGHSGVEIHKCRANANKVMARILYPLVRDSIVMLASFEGGTLRNAITRECFATLYISPDRVTEMEESVKHIFDNVKSEYCITDPNCYYELQVSQEERSKCVDRARALTYMQLLLNCPDGVVRMSDQMDNLVETSNNMAIVSIKDGCFVVKCLLRSSVDSAKESLCSNIEALFAMANIPVTASGGYSGWAPNAKSSILSLMSGIYREMFNAEAKVMAVHAGLECGILSGAYPEWDMISCGPTLLSPHSPDERCYIPSVQRVWDYLLRVLEMI